MTDFNLLYIIESSEEGWKQRMLDEINNISASFGTTVAPEFVVLTFDTVKEKLYNYYFCNFSGNALEKIYSSFIYNCFASLKTELINCWNKFTNYNKIDGLGDTMETTANPYTQQEETMQKSISKNVLNWKLTNDLMTFEPWIFIVKQIKEKIKNIVVKVFYNDDFNPTPPR